MQRIQIAFMLQQTHMMGPLESMWFVFNYFSFFFQKTVRNTKFMQLSKNGDNTFGIASSFFVVLANFFFA